MRLSALFATTLLFSASSAFADQVNVVTSIRPLENIVTQIGGEHVAVSNLVPANGSPHDYSLKPSDARALQNADLIFWIDEHLEAFLAKSIETLPKNAKVITLGEADGMLVYENRDLHLDVDDHHDDHGHDHEEGHDHDHDEDHAHEGEHEHEEGHDHEEAHEHEDDHDDQGHDNHDGHDHGTHDMHIWLDPGNVKLIAQIVADNLAENAPENKDLFAQNAEKFAAQIDAAVAEANGKLSSVKSQKFVTFHDAFQYFERHFELSNAGVITLSPETKPGAKRLTELKEALQSNKIACVFTEPQFDGKLVQLAIEGTNVKTAEIDPLGGSAIDGADYFPQLFTSIADAMAGCLGQHQ
jgi:zinc transport system substrate-binding protein